MRSGFTLIEITIALVVIMIVASLSMYGFRNARDSADLATMEGNVRLVAMGLERYADDHGGVYPTGLQAPAFKSVYIQGRALPTSPWSKLPQTTDIPIVAPADLTPEVWQDILTAAAQRNVPIGMATKGGEADRPTLEGHYGAICYEYDAARKVYHLVGYGRYNGRRVALAPCTNNAVGKGVTPN
jgi:type II secretory pathway pseudopilin PulG